MLCWMLPSSGQERAGMEEWEGNRDSFKGEMPFEPGFGGCLGHGPSEKGEKVIPSRGRDSEGNWLT